MQMAYQTTTKPIGLIKDLKMYIYGVPYIVTFTILHNIVIYPIIPCFLVDLGSKMLK